MAKFYTLLTKIGEALHANAQITQTTVPWTHMAIGDGGGNPVVPKQEQTGLVREVTRVPITSIAPDPNNPNWMIVEAVLPNNVGGWTVRETAIMGTPGGAQCIAVGNYPDTYKPVLAEGSVREMVLRMVVAVIGAGTVNLVIDPDVAIASRGWVESLTATTERRGIVELATATESQQGDDQLRAVTPHGLRKVVPKTARSPASLDINQLQETGLYYFNKGGNGPNPEYYGWVRHSDIVPGEFAFQEACSVEGGFWRRALNGAVWSDWKAIPTVDSITSLANDIAEKEGAIVAGAANTYFAGDKTWKPIADMPVRGAATDKAGVVKLATAVLLATGVDAEAALTSALMKPYLDAISAEGNFWVIGPGTSAWNVPPEVKDGRKRVRVRGVGGGASGAWSNSSAVGGFACGGSGAGGFDITLKLVGIDAVTCTVGAAGGSVGGSGSSVVGKNGGSTSFGTYASANGGLAGRIDGNTPTGGSSSSSVPGALLVDGQAGGYTISEPGSGGILGGDGGSSMLGLGGKGSQSGIAGTGFGAASGGAIGAGTPSKKGQDGILTIEVI
ncbi:phage tail protein [Comamonas testosteroni]|uniref:phage tail protein n=1 Tax=Comamonas testosteroni TaxID=285 RepID=UPI0028EBE2E6|nr:phage tail protein [Comamonas testosteroni]